ncbi:hypothetical protein [uncultured Mucilaginibacter sp.]|uniref:hypothetical protein n=1 Tax=uncultured Mucilaginibacter sp. TaxID=797541 RepID=UPI0025F4565D|nr:hypothetical protein [uncultured Mucilaginibacter sp.]
MFEPTQYPYSFRFSLGTLAVMAILMLLLLRNVLAVNSVLIWAVYGFCGMVFIGLSVVIITKRLIPAIKRDVALQLDDEGISDYIRDISIDWVDIKEITLLGGRSASTMKITLKFESDYGTEIAIPLRWIKGNDDEIYDTTLAYFEQITSTDPS